MDRADDESSCTAAEAVALLLEVAAGLLLTSEVQTNSASSGLYENQQRAIQRMKICCSTLAMIVGTYLTLKLAVG